MILLIRHGESEGNERGIVQGQLDTGLTMLGRLQAQHTAEALLHRGIDEIVTSPLRRARLTAEVIAGRLDLPIREDAGFMEYGFGELSGLTMEQIAERFPEVAQKGFASVLDEWPAIPGEEGRGEFIERVAGALARVRDGNKNIAVVTHGGFINAACHAVLGIDYLKRPTRFRSANCAITEVTTDRDGRWMLRRHNDACHIGARTVPMEA